MSKQYVVIPSKITISELAKKINIDIPNIVETTGINSDEVIGIDDILMILDEYKLHGICIESHELFELTVKHIHGLDICKPIISIVGHINHGKSTLVEHITGKLVCKDEIGSITQEITIYDCDQFYIIDSPGHAAFRHIREILMNISDLVVLIVAVNEGVQSETIDIISKSNHKNRLLCLNKLDLNPNYDVMKIYEQSARHGLIAKPFIKSGNVDMLSISGQSDEGAQQVIQYISSYFKRNKVQGTINRNAIGVILNTVPIKGIGVLTQIYLQSGILNKNDIYCYKGKEYKVRKILDLNLQTIPNIQMGVIGYIAMNDDLIAPIGTRFVIINNLDLRKQVCHLQIAKELNITPDIQHQYKVILITHNINQLSSLKTLFKNRVQIIKSYVNNDLDHNHIRDAIQNKSILITSFHISDTQKSMLLQNNIKWIGSDIIYHIIEEFNTYEQKENPYMNEEVTGKVKIKAIFHMNKQTILGGDVIEGKIELGNECKIMRDTEILSRGNISSLQKQKKNITIAKLGVECGMIIKTKDNIDYTIGDIVTAVNIKSS